MSINPAEFAHPKTYRADIDGLRAIAVTSVVLFHAGIPVLSGGFVGVDVFFVISGFLIGQIVDAEIASGTFSFLNFYVRRAKRILPALMVLSGLVLLAGVFLLAPFEFKDYAKSGFAALIGLGNIQFYRSIDYFAHDAHFNPFLMTWSLGVEEQFYVFLPPLLLLLYRVLPKARLAAVLLLSALSLATSILMTKTHPDAAFYLLPARAWELGVGVALAMWLRDRGGRPLPRSPRQADVMALVGLAAILLPVVIFSERTPFPGSAAIWPVLGAALLLAAQGSWINTRVLASSPFRIIGLLSYSWYLYHWPFMAFTRIVSFDPPSPWLLSLMALLSLGAAWLSWRFVETPFREIGKSANPLRILAAYGGAVGGLSAVFLGIWISNGLPGRLPDQAPSVDRLLAEQRANNCLVTYGQTEPDMSSKCWPNGARVALLGDSHAGALHTALRADLASNGIGLAALTKASCPSFAGIARHSAKYPRHGWECAAFNATAQAAILNDPDIDTVILTGLWMAVAFPSAGDRNIASDGGALPPHADDLDLLRIAIEDTIRQFTGAGKQVLLLSDAPLLNFPPVRQLQNDYLPLRDHLQALITQGSRIEAGVVDRAERVKDQDAINAVLAEVATEIDGARYRDISEAFCTATQCRMKSPEGQSFYVDSQHLSRSGAQQVFAYLALF